MSMTLCWTGDVDSQLMSLAGKLEREIIDDQWIDDQNTKESNDHRVYVSTDNHSDQFDPVYNEGQW